MVISRKRSTKSPPPPIIVQDTPLSLVDSVKYLGIQINSDLSWSPHVANLCNKVRRLIGLLYCRFYKHTDSTTLLQLYKSFVRPHLEYCSVVWNPYLAGDIDALERVQRFALRVCLKNWSADHNQLYNQSNIAPLSARQSNASLCHPFKMVNDLIDYPEPPPYNSKISITVADTPMLCGSGISKAELTNSRSLSFLGPLLYGTPCPTVSYPHLLS